ncbi:MAG: prepilin-type N-terminal cleavage/methylation domain-containing protein [Smithella sp.]|jgi:prepilin-type N-terminal cleavage/methylation domain-containing protein
MNKMEKTIIKKGFTLVELLIVIALMAIMASFAVPAWQHYTINTGMKTATREIIGDILNTRQRAIAENLNAYRITFDTANNNYALSRTDTGVTLWTRPLDSFGAGNVFYNVDLSGGSVINFQRRGTITDGTITLKNKVDSKATITLIMTGRVYAKYDLQK